ncbi:MAG: hypothetical protein ACT4PL_06925, partial [Phycisphaerales bacterium]
MSSPALTSEPPSETGRGTGDHHTASARSWPSSLWAVLVFTFLNSIGSAIIYSGIFFLAEFRYGFTT